jgi:peptidoglycan/LPS O-acetylase OafA/YrhL
MLAFDRNAKRIRERTSAVSASTAGHKLQGIEAARGVAASLVVVYHAARHLHGNGEGLPWALGIEKFGHAGVDFFFVLSGFIILFAHWGDVGVPASLSRYAERRCTRIFPLYWPVLAANAVLAVYGSRAWSPSFSEVVANITLAPTAREPIVGVAWTLQHEMLFYALFVALLVSRRWGLALIGGWVLWIVAIFLGSLEAPGARAWQVCASVYNLQFVMGMAAAWISRTWSVPRAGTVALAGAAMFFSVGIAESRGWIDGYADPARFLYGAAAWLFVVGIVQHERGSELRVPSWLALLGKASYSIYLVHLLVLGIAYKLLVRVGFAGLDAHVQHLSLVAIGILGGVAVSKWVEYPAMGAARRWWARAVGRAESPRG